MARSIISAEKHRVLCVLRGEILFLFVLAPGACAAPAVQTARTDAQASAVARPATDAGAFELDAPDAGKRAAGVHGAVASASPYASEAGLEILRAGGNAVDAAVATAFAIGVVEPQMSGLGGGGAMLIWRDSAAHADYIDFYPMQPAASFRGHTGFDGDGDLRIVGVPGNVAGLLVAHERFGRLTRQQVMAPAIRLAEQGFPVGQILATFIRSDSADLARYPEAYSRMYPAGRPLQVGEVLLNPDLGAALRHIALHGADAFYRGPLTAGIVETMNAGGHPVTVADFGGYEPVWRRPLCIAYEGRSVLSAPPPQTGAQVLHTLQLLEPFDFARLGLPTRDAAAFDALTSALRVGMADNRGVNDDPRWSDVPASGRVAPAFAAQRASLVGQRAAPDSIVPASAEAYDDAAPEAGCAAFDPYGPAPTAAQQQDRDAQGADADVDTNADLQDARVNPNARADDGTDANEHGETTHISVVDGDGNAVSLTQTNSTVFGSGAWVHGFFLNDSGYIFREDADLQSALSGAQPAWRTRTTTIAPTLVLADDDIELVIGAPGGGRIPTEIVQTMVYLLDYGMDPLEAVRMPRIYPSSQNARVQLEHGFTAGMLHDAREMGYDPIPPTPGYARLYLVARYNDQWVAVADPRHDGEARAY